MRGISLKQKDTIEDNGKDNTEIWFYSSNLKPGLEYFGDINKYLKDYQHFSAGVKLRKRMLDDILYNDFIVL